MPRKRGKPQRGLAYYIRLVDTTAQDLPLELSYQEGTMRVHLVSISLNKLNHNPVLRIRRVSMAYTIARDMPLELSYQARTIRALLVRIGLNRLNQSLVLPDARWKKKFYPIGRNFFLSCRQPPTRLPPAPPFHFRSR